MPFVQVCEWAGPYRCVTDCCPLSVVFRVRCVCVASSFYDRGHRFPIGQLVCVCVLLHTDHGVYGCDRCSFVLEHFHLQMK